MKHPSPPLVIKSFAKVNLYLRVINKRKDGFHNLDTLFSRIDLHDTVVLRGRGDSTINIKCAHRDVPKDRTNLCFRAADALRRQAGLSAGLDIEIKTHSRRRRLGRRVFERRKRTPGVKQVLAFKFVQGEAGGFGLRDRQRRRVFHP